ncbi:MAG: signal peptidase II [Candidatus Omnitrophica bacterium]|nr:signal peptidase II [Candidatus Omnitrophota bacterium]
MLNVISIFFLDQLTKYLATHFLSRGESFPVIPKVFHLTLVYNRGAAFGLLKDQLPIFIVTSLVAILIVGISLRRYFHEKRYRYPLSLILAGALGNLVDRLLWGHVIDFLDFRIWPVFNIADSAITIGAIILGWTLFYRKNTQSC